MSFIIQNPENFHPRIWNPHEWTHFLCTFSYGESYDFIFLWLNCKGSTLTPFPLFHIEISYWRFNVQFTFLAELNCDIIWREPLWVDLWWLCFTDSDSDYELWGGALCPEIKQRKDYWSSDYQDRRLLRLDAANPAINWSFAVFMPPELLSPATTERRQLGDSPMTRLGRWSRRGQRQKPVWPRGTLGNRDGEWALGRPCQYNLFPGRQAAIEVVWQFARLSASSLPPTADTRHSKQTFSQSSGRFWKNWTNLRRSIRNVPCYVVHWLSTSGRILSEILKRILFKIVTDFVFK